MLGTPNQRGLVDLKSADFFVFMMTRTPPATGVCVRPALFRQPHDKVRRRRRGARGHCVQRAPELGYRRGEIRRWIGLERLRDVARDEARQMVGRQLHDCDPIQRSLHDIEGLTVEQQAIAAAKGAATGKITASDIDRENSKGRRIHEVKSPLARVNDDEMLPVRSRSDSIGSRAPANAPNAEVGRKWDDRGLLGLAAGRGPRGPETVLCSQ